MVQASQSGTSVTLGRKVHLKFLVLRVALDANGKAIWLSGISKITDFAIYADYMYLA
jgi:hypothetical protein